MTAAATPLPVPQRIDFDNVVSVLDELVRAGERTAPGGLLTLDFAGLQDFDSSAISMLVELARRRHAPVTVCNAPPKLVELAELYGVSDLLLGSGDVR